MKIKGELLITDKIWFNDKNGCVLRISGFDKNQKLLMQEAKFIDIMFLPSIKKEKPFKSVIATIQIIK